MTETLHGWGRVPRVPGSERGAEDLEAASRDARLFRGMGRSYGDASLPASAADPVVHTRRADRLLGFDPERGILRAEAGLSLRTLNRIFWSRGFGSPVCPGTEHVTLGGMVSSDVHGSNHHSAGSIGRWLRRLRIRVADGRVLEASPDVEPELFWGAIGGMGLLGLILEVELELERTPSPWLVVEQRAYPDLDTLASGLVQAGRQFPFTKAWLDSTARGRSLGRGVLFAGRWAEPSEAKAAPPRWRSPPRFPFQSPSALANKRTIGWFNRAYGLLQSLRSGRHLVHPESFFFPLDVVRDWNRVYGARGFVQHQSVVESADTVQLLIEALQRNGSGSPITVLKDFGAEGQGLLSFPRPGLTLALDVPFKGEPTQRLIDTLNERTLAAGGRIYLAKDALSRAEHVRALEPRLAAFQELRAKWDPEKRFRSALSVRVLGDPA